MLSLEQKVGQMMMVGFHGLEPPDYILDWLSSGRVGGIILFGRNIASPKQLAELTQRLHETAAFPLLIAIDQEGGMVTRLREGFTESPGAMALGAADSEALAEDVAAVLGAEMRALGINWNLAPVVDITQNTENPSIGTRSLGSNTHRVSVLAAAQVRGLQNLRVAATAKHFPGKGNTPTDPHLALPVIDTPIERLWERDLVPFKSVIEAGIEAILVTPSQYTAVDPEYPSTLSPNVIRGLLREDLGFKGLVTTDCLEMKSVLNHYGPAEAAVLAALAGASTILFSHTRQYQEAAYNALLAAAKFGRVPDEQINDAVAHVFAMKEKYAVTDKPSLEDIRHPAHLITVIEAARAAVATMRASVDTLPIEPDDKRRVGLVEFASAIDSEIVESGGLTGFTTLIKEFLPKVTSLTLSPDRPAGQMVEAALELAMNSDILIIATRNAHLIPAQYEVARQLISNARKSVLLCLRNPYDVNVLYQANTILCTCGDTAPSLQAAAEVLVGHVIPTARLPVPIPLHV